MFIQLLILVLLLCYYYGVKDFNYWEKRGVKYETPLAYFGNYLNVFFFQKQSFAQYTQEVYFKYPKEKIVGSFRSTRPELIVRDPEIAKRILVKDFANFYRRKIMRSNNHEKLMQNLFFADGDIWKLVRQKMTSVFSTGKLKAMFPILLKYAERMQARVLVKSSLGHPIDARDLMAQYTTNVIGTYGFGIDMDSISEEYNAYKILGKKITNFTGRDAVHIALKEVFPKVFENLSIFTRLEDDFIKLIKNILSQRNFEPNGNIDFIDLLLKCKKNGKIVGESIENFHSDGTPYKIELEMNTSLIAAQVLVFFGAGYETSSSTSSYTLHLLAYHQSIQKKVQEEIDNILSKYGNKLSYDAVKEMTYLEWCFKESMRIFPSVGYLNRESATRYTIPEVNVTIDEGVAIVIPISAIQNDPKYFKNPEEFRPERFGSEEFDQNKFVYLPFGEGPRNCIGARLGLMQSLTGLAVVLSKFTVHPASNSKRYPTVDPTSNFVQQVLEGLPLIFIERQSTTI